MHQSGQERAHSMQTVQFSSFNAMTPRARGAGSSRSCGYCTVTAGLVIVLNVTPNPVSIPLISFFIYFSSRSLRREAFIIGRLHAPLPSGRFAVASHGKRP